MYEQILASFTFVCWLGTNRKWVSFSGFYSGAIFWFCLLVVYEYFDIFFFIFTYFELGLLYFSAFFKVVSLITISNIFYILNKAFWVAHFLKTEWKSNWKTLRELFLMYMYNWLLLLYLNKQGLVLQTKM